VLGGGLLLIALTAAGFSAEVAYPQMLVRFHGDPDPSLAQLMSALAIWCSHYAQIGAAVMIAVTMIAAWPTRVLPIWMVPVGVAAIVLGLLHTWIGLPSTVAGLVWIGVVGLLFVVGLTPGLVTPADD